MIVEYTKYIGDARECVEEAREKISAKMPTLEWLKEQEANELAKLGFWERRKKRANYDLLCNIIRAISMLLTFMNDIKDGLEIIQETK